MIVAQPTDKGKETGGSIMRTRQESQQKIIWLAIAIVSRLASHQAKLFDLSLGKTHDSKLLSGNFYPRATFLRIAVICLLSTTH